jgi:hypothetical protein
MTLDRFQREGLIRIGKRRTLILKPDLLRARPAGGDIDDA